jgi:hypothetical protein
VFYDTRPWVGIRDTKVVAGACLHSFSLSHSPLQALALVTDSVASHSFGSRKRTGNTTFLRSSLSRGKVELEASYSSRSVVLRLSTGAKELRAAVP